MPEPDCTELKVLVADIEFHVMEFILQNTSSSFIIKLIKKRIQNSLRKSLDKLVLNIPEVESGSDGTLETDYTHDSDAADVAARVAMVCYRYHC